MQWNNNKKTSVASVESSWVKIVNIGMIIIKDSGFCKNAACSNHLRKKRKNKHNAKFARICDEC